MKILGVGGHAKVVIDALRCCKVKIDSIYDDDANTHGKEFCGYTVAGNIDDDLAGEAVIAIGSNAVRRSIDNKLKKVEWGKVIHPSAILAEDVEIGEGSVIMAGVVIQPGSKIGRHCIVNTGACIDHDCTLEDFCHIGPNSSLAGGVKVGEGAFVGIGSSVTQYLLIGEWTILGSGSAVIKDLPANCTAVGVPAKPIKFHE